MPKKSSFSAPVPENWTPDQALNALQQLHPLLRAPNKRVIAQLRAAFTEGRWYPEVAKPIVFVGDQIVNGGALITMISRLDAGTKVPVLVQRDTSMDAVSEIDFNQATRTWGQVLKFYYPDQSQSTLNTAAGIAHLVKGYDGPGNLPDLDAKVVHFGEMKLFVDQWAEILLPAAELANRINSIESGKDGAITTAATIGFVLFMLHKEDGIEDFFLRLAQQEQIPAGDPRNDLLNHYKQPKYDLRRHPYRNSKTVTLQRIAELFGIWDVFVNGGVWIAWDGSEGNFKHPVIGWGSQLGWD